MKLILIQDLLVSETFENIDEHVSDDLQHFMVVKFEGHLQI